jgi:hypothetical protein
VTAQGQEGVREKWVGSKGDRRGPCDINIQMCRGEGWLITGQQTAPNSGAPDEPSRVMAGGALVGGEH